MAIIVTVIPVRVKSNLMVLFKLQRLPELFKLYRKTIRRKTKIIHTSNSRLFSLLVAFTLIASIRQTISRLLRHLSYGHCYPILLFGVEL